MPAWLSALFALIQIIPKLIELVERIGVERAKGWVSDLEKVVDQNEKAQTPAEKLAVARSYVDLIRRL